MKKLLLLAFLLYSFISNAQKIAKDEVDKFTKVREIKTSELLVFPSTFKEPHNLWLKIGLSLSESGMITLGLHFKTDRRTSISARDRIVFLLDDGQQIVLNAPTYYRKVHFSANPRGSFIPIKWEGVKPSYYLYPAYDKDEFEALTTKTITDIRIYTNRGYADYSISKKNAAKIKKAILLVMKEVEY